MCPFHTEEKSKSLSDLKQGQSSFLPDLLTPSSPLCYQYQSQPAPCRFPSPAGYLPAAFQRACGQTADAAAGPELLRATGPELWPQVLALYFPELLTASLRVWATWSTQADRTKYHRQGSLNERNISHCSRGQQSRIKVWQGRFHSEAFPPGL